MSTAPIREVRYINGATEDDYDEELHVSRQEDWYALQSYRLRGKKVKVTVYKERRWL